MRRHWRGGGRSRGLCLWVEAASSLPWPVRCVRSSPIEELSHKRAPWRGTSDAVGRLWLACGGHA